MASNKANLTKMKENAITHGANLKIRYPLSRVGRGMRIFAGVSLLLLGTLFTWVSAKTGNRVMLYALGAVLISVPLATLVRRATVEFDRGERRITARFPMAALPGWSAIPALWYIPCSRSFTTDGLRALVVERQSNRGGRLVARYGDGHAEEVAPWSYFPERIEERVSALAQEIGLADSGHSCGGASTLEGTFIERPNGPLP
jgi:hypothetical protein